MAQYLDIDQIVSTTLPTVQKLFEYKNWGDALLLYFRYVQQKRMQANSLTFSNNDFMKKATWWGTQRLQNAKKVLIELHFIEEVIRRWEWGKIQGTYIKINFVIDSNAETSSEALYRQTATPPGGETETNTLVLNINTLVENKNTWNTQILQEHLKNFPAGSTRYKFFFSMLQNASLLLFDLDTQKLETIEKKLSEFREKLGEEKSRLELESFWEHHSIEKTQIKSMIGRLNTWLGNKLTPYPWKQKTT